MKKIEQLELDAHRGQMADDMRKLFEKYRAIFEWDIPDVDQEAVDKIILAAMHAAVDEVAMQKTT